MNYAPVCGDNGISFANECIATCQGIAVSAQGLCGAPASNAAAPVAAARAAQATPSFPTPDNIAAGASVSLATLTKHRAEGFSFIARVKLDANAKVQPLPTDSPTQAATARCAVCGQPRPDPSQLVIEAAHRLFLSLAVLPLSSATSCS